MKAKNVAIFFGIFAVLIAALVALNSVKKENVYGVPASKLNSETKALLKDPHYNNIIIPDELEKMIADKKSFFVYYFSPTCPHCKATTPLLKPLADELGINMHQFNLLEFQNYFNRMNIEVTPTLVYYKDGVEASRLRGGLTEGTSSDGNTLDDYRKFFNDHKSSGND